MGDHFDVIGADINCNEDMPIKKVDASNENEIKTSIRIRFYIDSHFAIRLKNAGNNLRSTSYNCVMSRIFCACELTS